VAERAVGITHAQYTEVWVGKKYSSNPNGTITPRIATKINRNSKISGLRITASPDKVLGIITRALSACCRCRSYRLLPENYPGWWIHQNLWSGTPNLPA